jgi:predicted permease
MLHPTAMYLRLSYAGIADLVWLFPAVLLAALPTATNVFLIAQYYGMWIERASACVLFATVISVVTLSLPIYAATTDPLPPKLFAR